MTIDIVDFPIDSMVIFHSPFVSLPEGILWDFIGKAIENGDFYGDMNLI